MTRGREVVPLVLYDHDGFASGVLDGEPSWRWPDDCRGGPDWDEAVAVAGPPLYGVPAVREVERSA